MALDTTIKSAVAVAASVTRDLQDIVQHHTWVSQDGLGAATYRIVPRRALVEHKVQLRKLSDGRLVPVKSKLTLLEEVSANGAPGRNEPVDPRDKFVLSDGSSGTIVDVSGLINPGQGRPFLVEVFLG
jgi:hypothetical protein